MNNFINTQVLKNVLLIKNEENVFKQDSLKNKKVPGGDLFKNPQNEKTKKRLIHRKKRISTKRCGKAKNKEKTP